MFSGFCPALYFNSIKWKLPRVIFLFKKKKLFFFCVTPPIYFINLFTGKEERILSSFSHWEIHKYVKITTVVCVYIFLTFPEYFFLNEKKRSSICYILNLLYNMWMHHIFLKPHTLVLIYSDNVFRSIISYIIEVFKQFILNCTRTFYAKLSYCLKISNKTTIN